MSTYTFVESLDELKPWIKDEVIFDGPVIEARNRKGGIRERRVQEWLVYHGERLEVDAWYGNVTKTLVEKFQQENGLNVTGKVDKNTYDTLVKPMVDILRKPASVGIGFNEALLLHAQRIMSKHPIELGNTPEKGNCGAWVRIFMKGLEDKWCAGFACFAMNQAAETSGRKVPFATSFSVDSVAGYALNKGLRVGENDMERGEIPPGSMFLIRKSPGDWSHIGFVTDSHLTHYHTIEGNADHNRSVNGFEVTSVWRGYSKTDYIVFGEHDISVRQYFYEGPSSYTYGSFFKHWGGWITAKHVVDDMDMAVPPFASGRIEAAPDDLDAALIGCTLPDDPPPQLVDRQEIVVRGYPAGSRTVEERIGHVHFHRAPYVDNENIRHGRRWIIQIDYPEEPVVTGMSGGLAFDRATGEPVGIIATTNSRGDIDGTDTDDGVNPGEEHSLDIVSLRDVWDAFHAEPDNPIFV